MPIWANYTLICYYDIEKLNISFFPSFKLEQSCGQKCTEHGYIAFQESVAMAVLGLQLLISETTLVLTTSLDKQKVQFIIRTSAFFPWNEA